MKTLVVEDSRLAREGLVRMLARFPQLEVIGSGENANKARTIIEQHRPGLLFLDIHMPGDNGFELLESIDYQPCVIFTTAYSDYAIRSFDYLTIDYLLKPISHKRLSQAVNKLTCRLSPNTDSEAPLELAHRIFIKDKEKCHLIQISDIDYLESCKNYTKVYFLGNSAFVKRPLTQLERRLPSPAFVRASRQHVINLQRVERIEEAVHDGYTATMANGVEINISRRAAIALRSDWSF